MIHKYIRRRLCYYLELVAVWIISRTYKKVPASWTLKLMEPVIRHFALGIEIPSRKYVRAVKEVSDRIDLFENVQAYNPIRSKEGPDRHKMVLLDYMNGESVYIPVSMMRSRFILALIECGSVSAYIKKYLRGYNSKPAREAVFRKYIRLRCKHDIPFFAGLYLRFKDNSDPVTKMSPSMREDVKIVHKMIFRKGCCMQKVQQIADRLGWFSICYPYWLQSEGESNDHLPQIPDLVSKPSNMLMVCQHCHDIIHGFNPPRPA